MKKWIAIKGDEYGVHDTKDEAMKDAESVALMEVDEYGVDWESAEEWYDLEDKQ